MRLLDMYRALGAALSRRVPTLIELLLAEAPALATTE